MPTFGTYNGSISPLMKWYGEYSIVRISNTLCRVDVTVTGEIKNHAYTSWMGTGNSIVVTVTVNGESRSSTLKSTTDTWRGNSRNPRSCAFSFQIASSAAGESVSIGYAVAGSGYTAAAAVPAQSTTATTSALLYTPSTVGLSVPELTLGDVLTITITRQHDFMTHTLRWAVGGASGVIAENVGTAHTWVVPVSLANHIPAAESGTLRITCETFADGASVGSTAAEVTVIVPADILPSITSTAHRRIDNGVPEEWGIYVQGYSKVQFAVQASGAYGSSITAVKISGGGYSNLSANGTTGALNTAGVNTFTITATDSRGRTAEASVDIEVMPYAKPMVANTVTERCAPDGTLTDDGEQAWCRASAVYSDCGGKNSVTCAIYTRKAGDATWHKAADWVSGTGQILIGPFSSDRDYEVQYTIADGIASGYKTALLPAADALIDAADDNGVKSFGFGGPATVPGKALFYVPIVFADGTELIDVGDGYIRLCNVLICRGQMTVKYAATTAATGSSYYGDSTEISGGVFARKFAAAPTINLTVRQGTTSMLEIEAVDVSETGINQLRIHRANSYTDDDGVLVDYIAVGMAETEVSHD